MTASPVSADDLAPLIAERAEDENRFFVAISGPPGAGKSTLAEKLVRQLNRGTDEPSIVVPMDGFHYDNAVLKQRRLLPRKGAPETFDVAGLAFLLGRLADPTVEVAIPLFDRDLEIARAGAAIVTPAHRIVIVEGNYLLLDERPWRGLICYFDLTIAINVPFEELRGRLVKRWLDHGHALAAAEARAESNDIPNARRVLSHSRRADIVVVGDEAWSGSRAG